MSEAPDWPAYAAGAIVETFENAWLLGGARTPFVDYNGSLRLVSPTDLGIHVARAALDRADRAPLGAARRLAGRGE